MINDYEIHGNVVYIKINDCDNKIISTRIDLEDLPKLLKYDFKWAKHKHGYVNTTTKKVDGLPISISLHRFIMDFPQGLEIDHINFNKLDNRKSVNLRIVNRYENAQNAYVRKDSKSGFRGVTKVGSSKLWKAQCTLNGKLYNLGHFIDKEEASEVVSKFRAENMKSSFEYRNSDKILEL